MMQDCASSNKIKENKYKILRMSLLLGSDENKVETINNFEDAAREIDAMNDEIYLKDLEGKFYDTSTLEDEEKKLAVLVDYIGGRVEQRISLLTDFANVTGFDLQNLPPIKYYDKLDDYKDRLGYIREYLSNVDQLKRLNDEVGNANVDLERAYKNKAAAEEFNLRNEDIILNKFQHVISSLDYFKDINSENVSDKLSEVMASVEESKKSLDIFTKSFTTLSKSGISMDEEEEYRSYVTNAQDVYYVNKEQEYFIRLYQYFIHKESDYASLLVKRDCINDLLCERMALRRDLNIQDNDLLSGMYDLLQRQYEDIQQQRGNIEQIDRLNDLIQSKKEEISELEVDNQKVEILALLREFGIIDTYSDASSGNNENEVVDSYVTEDESVVSDSSLFDEKKDEYVEHVDNEVDYDNNSMDVSFEVPNVVSSSDVELTNVESVNTVNEEDEVVYADNQVVAVSDSGSIDLDLVHSKANKVMQRVGEMLGIKPKDDSVISVSQEDVIPKEDVVASAEAVSQSSDETVVDEVPDNPMFRENVVDTSDSSTDSADSNLSMDSNFWFPSETPDALNDLPDLDVSNASSNSDNFFANNPISDLSFPDLKVDFGNNDVEG